MHDKELRGSGVGVAGTRHGQNTSLVLQVIGHITVGDELAADGLAGLLIELGSHATALDHESTDDTVKDQTLVESALHQGEEILNRLGCLVGTKLHHDLTQLIGLIAHLGNCQDDLGEVTHSCCSPTC